MATPELSIVMATYNRAHTLRRSLDHLAKQDVDADRFEVIVIDDHSPDQTPDVVAEIQSSAPYRLKFLRNDVNRGPGYTQNRGIRAAEAPLLWIMTDDVLMTPGALRAHLEFHRGRPEPQFGALGRVLQSPELNHTVLMRVWDPFRFPLLKAVEELPYYMFWACNVSCKREFMLRHGMFREHQGRAGSVAFEDLEVGYRLSKHGLRIFYVPEALGYHYHEYTLEQAIGRWYERGLNFGQFREFAPDPVLTVYFHVLDFHTFREYARALRGPNPFRGRERSFAWHLFRHAVRLAVLNRVTAPLVWRPFLDAVERFPWLERCVTSKTYRAFLYYQFLRGVRDGRKRFGD